MTTPEETLRTGGPTRGSLRGALASRDFSLLFVGQLGSEIGNGLVLLALPWLVLQLTGSALQLGVAYFFQFLPMLLFGLLGGVFVDRFDRRLTIVVVDAVRGLAFISFAVVVYSGTFVVEHLYAVIFLDSTLQNFFNPARAALVPNLVSPHNLRSANSLVEVSRHLGILIAPPVGLMIAVLGPEALLLLDGCARLLSAGTVFLIRWRQPVRERLRSEGWLHSIRIVANQTGEGLKTIGRVRLLQVAVLLGLALNLIVAPIQVLLPLFVREVKQADADYFGFLVAGLLLGLILGSLSAPHTARRLGLGRMSIGAICLLGIVISVASWPPTIWPPLVSMIIAGFAIGSLNVAQVTLLQGSTSDEERGRVTATYFTATLGVRPFGFLAVGALAGTVDIRLMFVALGILALVIGVGLARIREVREAR